MKSGNMSLLGQRDQLVCRGCRSATRQSLEVEAHRTPASNAEEVQADSTSLWVSRWVR